MQSTRIGDLEVHKIAEYEGPFISPETFFPDFDPEVVRANPDHLGARLIDEATGHLLFSFHTFIVKTGHHTILIDSCLGNDKERPTRPQFHRLRTPYIADLAKAGVKVEDVDYVMCTHLHWDHVGWNTRLENGRWVPPFPKAKYVMADRELAHWTQKERDDPAGVPWITDSVLPIVAARREQVVKSDFVLNELVRFIPTPGHTIDHYSVLAGRPGADALITGDMIHSPIQGKYPELGMRADYDSQQAGQTRRKIFDRFCDEPTLMCIAHFPAPSAARVRRWSEGYKFVA